MSQFPNIKHYLYKSSFANLFALYMTSPFLFRPIGGSIIQHRRNVDSRTFVAFFGICPLGCYHLWRLIVDEDKVGSQKLWPKYLMWALLFLRNYQKEEVMCAIIGVSKKIVKKWIWIII